MENLNTNLVAENTSVVGILNEELNENPQNNGENKMLNVSNNLVKENGVVINEDTINIDTTIIAVNEDISVNVSYVASDNSTYPSELSNRDNDTNKYNISVATAEELSYLEIRNNCYSEEYLEEYGIFKMLKKKQIFIWMTSEGDYCYKFGHNGTVKEVTASKLKTILKNKLKFPVYIDNEDPIYKDKNINTSCLHLVSEDAFDPHQDKEFFEKNGQTYRNLFVKTEYLLLNKNTKHNEPKIIIDLVKNLVNNDEERYIYLMNWLANFIQTMERTPIAIIIKGKQGTGKNLFIDKVLRPILSKEQVALISKEELLGKFIGTIFENKLFYIFDEISHSYKDNFQLQNRLKQIIGSDDVFMEKKYENTKSETKLWGPIFLFSNKSVPIAIETNSRREVVFKSGEPLSKIDFLGCGSYENLCDKIKSELRDFTLTLLNWEVDKNMASIAMDTPEKIALANMTHDKIALFNEAITSGDISYFEELKEEYPEGACLYNELEANFKAHKVKKSNLAKIYNALYEEKISTITLKNMLKTYDDEFYDDSNLIGDGKGGKYFLLEDHPKKGLKNSEYIEDVSIQNIASANFPPKPLF